MDSKEDENPVCPVPPPLNPTTQSALQPPPPPPKPYNPECPAPPPPPPTLQVYNPECPAAHTPASRCRNTSSLSLTKQKPTLFPPHTTNIPAPLRSPTSFYIPPCLPPPCSLPPPCTWVPCKPATHLRPPLEWVWLLLHRRDRGAQLVDHAAHAGGGAKAGGGRVLQ